MTHSHTPLALIIMDGWGYRQETEHNAIAAARTPNWDRWWQQQPHTLLNGSGAAVGLPTGQMGNSEVGHMHLGAGRLLEQDFTRISRSIDKGELAHSDIIQQAVIHAQRHQSAIHILGLLSPGGIHSHETHIHALCQTLAAQGVNKLFVHAFLDGRDTPPRSANASLKHLQQQLEQQNCGQIASISGRYYAMDRDQRWQRTQTVYDMLTTGTSPFQANNALDALHDAYERGENDEFVQATKINTHQNSQLTNNDVVIFMNFRADRARQLSYALTANDFTGFSRQRYYPGLHFVSLTQYAANLPNPVIYPPQKASRTLGEILAEQGCTQLRIAETEKYAHVTFFFNGGHEQPFAGEERCLIPSPQVATYDLQPEMSAHQVTAKLIQAIEQKQYDVIICNFANPDMVGHTGDFQATVQAVECIDQCLGDIAQALHAVGGEMMVTADHGNAEKMYDADTQQAHTAHTCDPVPFLYLGRNASITHQPGTLIDIAPTVLYALGLQPPDEMTGRSLIRIDEA